MTDDDRQVAGVELSPTVEDGAVGKLLSMESHYECILAKVINYILGCEFSFADKMLLVQDGMLVLGILIFFFFQCNLVTAHFLKREKQPKKKQPLIKKGPEFKLPSLR